MGFYFLLFILSIHYFFSEDLQTIIGEVLWCVPSAAFLVCLCVGVDVSYAGQVVVGVTIGGGREEFAGNIEAIFQQML